jgi:CubicO group peptidase (beta-lactamase class C family)
MALFHTRRVQLDGHLHPAFRAVADRLRGQLAETPGGAAVCVYHRGQCVVDLWGGVRNDAGDAWEADTMAPSFSTTKGVASTLVHIMVDRGLLDYDEPVMRYWPEFGQAGKERITLRHVLAHQSGLYHIRQMIDRAERMLDWDYMIHAIEQAAPVHAPGERTGYHGLTYGYLVGEILQRVTGAPFSELVRRELAEPLALDGFFVGAPESELRRAASLMWPRRNILTPALPAGMARRITKGASPAIGLGARLLGFELDVQSIIDSLAPRGIGRFDFGASDTLQVSIPAANGLFTARSLARMYAALAQGGEIDGVRLMSPQTLHRATRRQTHGGGLSVIPFDMRWRLGYHGVFTTQGSPRNAFGHFGFGGSGGWADPSRELSVALIVNAGLGTPFGDMRIARISAAALRGVEARRAGAGEARARSERRTAATGARPAGRPPARAGVLRGRRVRGRRRGAHGAATPPPA